MLKVGFVSLEQLTTENQVYEKRMRKLLKKKLEKEEEERKKREEERKKREEEKKNYNSAMSITCPIGLLSLLVMSSFLI